MNLRKLLLIVVSVSILAGLSACKKNVSVLVFDTPVEQGSASIVIKTTRTDGLSISDYTLEITGPVSKTETVSGDTYTLENVVAGTYQVKASKTNFIGTVKTVTVGAIEDNKTMTYTLGLSLTEKRAPVTVDNTTGGTITVPAANTSAPGVAGNTATVVIPPGAIPGGGTTQITITPVPTAVIDNPQSSVPTGGLGGFYFVMEPSGLVFEEPLTLTFEMDIPGKVAQNIEFFMIYRLADGTYSTDPNDKVPVSFNDQGTLASVQISHFSDWVLGANCELVQVEDYGVTVPITKSLCGGGINETWSITGTYGPIYSTLSGLPGITLIEDIVFPAIPFIEYSPTVFYYEAKYELRNTDGTAIESFTLPENTPVVVQSGASTCHNSGGG